MRKIMEMTFAGEDAEVLTAASADEGIAAAQRFTPDVVFADASMSGKDGYAVASAIKSNGGNAPVVIVMASQHIPYDEAKGAASGVDDHVAKPFDSQAIIDKVSAAMSGGARKPAAAVSGGPVQAASGTPARSLKRTMAFGSPARPPVPPPTPPAPPAAKAQLEVVEDDDPVIELSPPPAAKRVPSKKPAPKRSAPPAAPVAPAAVAPAAAATASGSALAGKLDALGLSKEQVEAVLALSRDVVEQVVWEVVPDMAETMIREELRRLMK